MLLDVGNVDEAIRQFNYVLQRAPEHVLALTLQAQAYRLKELYQESVDSARKAIRLAPRNAEPHLWLGREPAAWAGNTTIRAASTSSTCN